MHTTIALLLMTALVAPVAAAGTPDPPPLHHLFTLVLERHVHDGRVNYTGISRDPMFRLYLEHLADINPDTLKTRNERLAFWINAYNAFTIKLIVNRWPLRSIRDISLGLPILFGPWSIEIGKVNGKRYTLNAIEHDIIRPAFAEPRIHCALVCAAASCPKLRGEAYDGSCLDTQLEEETYRFLNDSTRNDITPGRGEILLSKIFDWYDDDFDQSGGVRSFVARYLPPAQGRWITDPAHEIDYLDYDWALNGQ